MTITETPSTFDCFRESRLDGMTPEQRIAYDNPYQQRRRVPGHLDLAIKDAFRTVRIEQNDPLAFGSPPSPADDRPANRMEPT